MKNKKLFLMLPLISLVACANESFLVEISYADAVKNVEGIEEIQKRAAFALPELIRYEEESFDLTQEANSTSNTYNSFSFYLDTESCVFSLATTEQYVDEKAKTSQIISNKEWIYLGENSTCIYHVTNSASEKSFVSYTIPLGIEAKAYFKGYIADLYSDYTLDYRGEDYLDLDKVINDRNAQNILVKDSCEVTFSEFNAIKKRFEYQIDINYEKLPVEDVLETRKSNETCHWEDGFFTSYVLTLNVDLYNGENKILSEIHTTSRNLTVDPAQIEKEELPDLSDYPNRPISSTGE